MENKNRMLAFIEAPNTIKALVKFLSDLNLDMEATSLTLTNVLKESTGKKSLMEDLMGDAVAETTLDDVQKLLDKGKRELLEYGFAERRIKIDILKGKNITDALIKKIKEDNYSMILLGRKYNMSKAEEFALGDISSRMIRAPVKITVIVLKTNDES